MPDEEIKQAPRCMADKCWRKAEVDPAIEFCALHLPLLEKQHKGKWSVAKVQAYIKHVTIPTDRHKNSVAGFVEQVMEAQNAGK